MDCCPEDCWNEKLTTTALCRPRRKNARNSPGNFGRSLSTNFPNTVAAIHTPASLAYPGSGRTLTASSNCGSPANTECPCSSFLTKTIAAASKPANFDFIKVTFRKEKNDIAGWHHHSSAGAVAPALPFISLSNPQLFPKGKPL